jgi:hypothetical protein
MQKRKMCENLFGAGEIQKKKRTATGMRRAEKSP